MKIMSETDLKIKILSHGVIFSQEALNFAFATSAKTQNLVYNKPKGVDNSRPQELIITSFVDNYKTVVSCVVPTSNKEHIFIDYKDNQLIASQNNKIFQNISLDFVKEPGYYSKKLLNGDNLKKYISSCGLDELNIIPYKGCAISSSCLFCGVNTVSKKENSKDIFTAFKLGKNNNWDLHKDVYLKNLCDAINLAKNDECFQEHLHLIIISGDLPNEELDIQSKIYADISDAIYPHIVDAATDGIVVVMMPPNDYNLLNKLKEAHISKIVFNMEVANEPYFSKYCPGKSNIGLEHIKNSLKKSVSIFGKGNVWSNFVLGLEPINLLENVCEELAELGIVAGANVLHIDSGSKLDCNPPSEADIIEFFNFLANLYRTYNFKPFYCGKALRTSLINEFFDNRILK